MLQTADCRIIAAIFAKNEPLDGVAAGWTERWKEHNAAAMTELINFVLRCTGCKKTVDIHDIEDSENAVSKLTDLQDEYASEKPTDYPLVSRLKGYASFRTILTKFFQTLIATCHRSNLLYSDLAIIENIEVWVSTMSSSGMRPFRHTATVISLAIGIELARIAAELTTSLAHTTLQKESETNKKSKQNKKRVSGFDDSLAELERKKAQVEEPLNSIFDAVYVHRYRDVDPKIRVDCVTALGTWIVTYPDLFFEGAYLRYLGWVLSDTHAPTRAEDIKQLTLLYKNKENIARLRTFTERFRERLIEMAMRDSEVTIRAATIELLGLVRDASLLEPDDIDAIGSLIFDAEPSVRQAVASFFAASVQETFEELKSQLEGDEVIADMLQNEKDAGFDTPRLAWLKLKIVVEQLGIYDNEPLEDETETPKEEKQVIASGANSRYAFAAQTVCDKHGIDEAEEWETVAGYLLYDFSAASSAFEEQLQLSDKDQILLLEILNASVKRKLKEAAEDEAGKRTNKQKENARSTQEAAAIHLTKIIPDLLKKFGSSPATTSAVLRLGHLLDLEVFSKLQEDSAAYATLLEDINKQFLSHSDAAVLSEASGAILHAREVDELEEVTEGKVQELWDDTISVLRAGLSQPNWAETSIANVSDAVKRITHLSSIMDCTAIFATAPRAAQKQKKTTKATSSSSSDAKTATPLDLLLFILRDPALDSAAGEDADDALTNTMQALLLYHMWQARSLQSASPSSDFDPDSLPYTSFSTSLLTVAQGRHASSPVRVAALSTLLDLHTLFATFRHKATPLPSLVHPVPSEATPLIISTFSKLEQSFAAKGGKHIDLPTTGDNEDVDAAPEGLEDDEDDEDDEEEERGLSKEQKALVAEKKLCEFAGKIVLALVARVLDASVRPRVSRNRLKLGNHYKEVVAYLDRDGNGRIKARPKRRPAAAAGTAGGVKIGGKNTAQKVQPGKKSQARVIEEEESESDDGVGLEEGGEEDLRRRELEDDPVEEVESEEDVRAGGQDETEDEDEVMGD